MRRKIILFILVVLGTYSCLKDTENKDHDSPSVAEVRFNVNDTIRFRYPISTGGEGFIYKRDSIYINKSKEKIDTVVLGRPILFSGHFTDNDDLSSCRMKVLLKLDTTGISKRLEKLDTDSVFLLQTFSVTGQDSIVTNFHGNKFITTDSISKKLRVLDTIPMPSPDKNNEEGDDEPKYEWKLVAVKEGKYTLEVTIMDRGGNKSTSEHDVWFINFETLKKNRDDINNMAKLIK